VSETLRTRISKAAERAATEIDDVQLGLLEQYLQLLARWNRTISLTAVPLENFPEPTLDRLLVEPMLAARFVPSSTTAWYDLGSGGGSPAIPLKILRPRAPLTMIESKSRKAAFLRETVRSLRLLGADVLEARFESLGQDHRNSADLLTVRAVRRDTALRQTAGALLHPEGRLLAFGARSSTLFWADFAVLERCDLPGSGDVLEVLTRQPVGPGP
jgi:16S rRNA (guanine527-N7)-methyltransferase